MFKKGLFIIALFGVIVSLPLFGAEPTVKIEPYTKDQFPSWAQDLRRAEIVTLGSLPFTTLSVSLGYSVYRYIKYDFDNAYFPNPLAKSSTVANLNSDEQKNILLVSAGISILVGVTDFIVSTVKRNIENKKIAEEEAEQNKIIQITTGELTP